MAKAQQHQRVGPSHAPVERTSALEEGRRDHPPGSAETPPPKPARPIAAAGRANIGEAGPFGFPSGCEPQPEQNFELGAGPGGGATGAGLGTGSQQGGGGRGVEGLVGRREYSHGPFEGSAAIAQRLKGVYRDGWNWGRLSHGQREALEQIAAKIARILTGAPEHPDHWDDLAGYALLGKANPYDSPEHLG